MKYYSFFFCLIFIIISQCGYESHTSPLPQQPDKKEQYQQKHSDSNTAIGDESLMKEWEEHMNDFAPTDMVTFVVDHRSQETLFTDIVKMPQLLRGAFFLTSEDNSAINFKILDPQQKTIFFRENTKETIFYVSINIPGTYSFLFSNDRFLESKQVTFAVQYETQQEKLSEKDISPIESRLIKIDQGVEVCLLFSLQYFGQRTLDSKRDLLKKDKRSCISTRKRIFLFTLIETLAILGTSFWQISYIKKMLDNRRIV